MNDSKLQELDEIIANRIGFPVVSIEHKAFLAMGLAGEVGELVEEIQRTSAALCNNVKKEWRDGEIAEMKLKIQREIADCYIYLDRLAHQYGVTLEACVEEKLEVLEKRVLPARRASS